MQDLNSLSIVGFIILHSNFLYGARYEAMNHTSVWMPAKLPHRCDFILNNNLCEFIHSYTEDFYVCPKNALLRY